MLIKKNSEIYIVQFKNKQYTQIKGKYIKVDYIGQPIGSKVEGVQIFAIYNADNDNPNVRILQQPVGAYIVDQVKGKKIFGMTYRRRSHSSKRTHGTRPLSTIISICEATK